jgi:hypothetical protein
MPHLRMQLGNPDTGEFRGYKVDLLNRALEDMHDDGSRQSLLFKWFADGSIEVNS